MALRTAGQPSCFHRRDRDTHGWRANRQLGQSCWLGGSCRDRKREIERDVTYRIRSARCAWYSMSASSILNPHSSPLTVPLLMTVLFWSKPLGFHVRWDNAKLLLLHQSLRFSLYCDRLDAWLKIETEWLSKIWWEKNKVYLSSKSTWRAQAFTNGCLVRNMPR